LPESIRVVAAALFDSHGRVLIAQRLAGKHMAGRWEFPGGKIDAHETEREALRRELHEELGVEVLEAARVLELTHDYPERRVHLALWHVTRYAGDPHGRDGQSLKWVAPPQLANEDLLEADQPITEWLLQASAGERQGRDR
jgi:8-oxo-dGTP diphosphatase